MTQISKFRPGERLRWADDLRRIAKGTKARYVKQYISSDQSQVYITVEWEDKNLGYSGEGWFESRFVRDIEDLDMETDF